MEQLQIKENLNINLKENHFNKYFDKNDLKEKKYKTEQDLITDLFK